MNRTHFLIGLSFLLLASLATPILAADLPRYVYVGSSNIRFPTGYTRSETAYISDDNQSAICYSQKLIGKFLEVSALQHFSGSAKNKTIFSCKVNLLEEDQLTPNVVWGLSDVTTRTGDRFQFMAASKTFEAFGTTLHAGYVHDRVQSKNRPFYGLEKTILPLVAVAGESFDGRTSLGLKMRPYPGLSIDYATRDISTNSRADIYKLSYFLPF